MTFDERLLDLPVARAAYSDRSAWLMAELARLAYERFESPPEALDELCRRVAQASDTEAIKAEIEAFLPTFLEAQGDGLDALRDGLGRAGFELVATFNNAGTQAYLARRPSDKIAVLAFRGTEKDFRDIKTDLNARFYRANGARVHTGFQQAFDKVASGIERSAAEVEDYKLYVTGHSLGGALALVASRALSGDNVAACYTFGSPRVGDSEFGDPIKVPIYRVVNAADAVPRVPPTWFIEIVIVLARLIPIPFVRAAVVRFFEQFRGYRHHGDMRYLTASHEPDRRDLRLIANPNLFDRTRWLIARLSLNLKAGFLDHRIAEYCDKLRTMALRRYDKR